MAQPHIVALCGSLRDGSYTRLALEHALAGASEAGGTTELVDLRELDLPTLNPDYDEQGDSAELTRIIDEADAVILGTPVYHGSYSGVLKNALDHCGFDEFGDKTVGLLAVAGGSFPVTALEHLRSVCRALNAWVLPHQAAIPSVSSAFEDGVIVDDDLRERVERLGRDAVVYTNIEAEPPTLESSENVGADD
ncbi:NADPH-dependent oxidoreductase [Haloferax mediterranei ATCC 33500]|uniref:FMN reductase n=1 Tax=Haloferax mediterranei (strain ATCC 33500 / DSM 1411 / JCM 8866 / NBRC 14739 / NCIMB 2177 / R-4) TaxID=523841 RepID=I3R8J6_HALMT|nr:NADPH-dependent FMN reductase [Haloferax mediterranei]AFK20556.2 NADPH-dependent FMN reductase [Haloferax mediterranei ATCC 33500]AHZ23913.1 FMN reductase [Haloferax mediterranei ATCC 33500]ELZ98338.1 NADPH-dependent FMN reductase [Haloferax mediterranei ATCC 33500]MDX5986689.1 NADPH-dependent FMN reductase [Haloferax mediterranei ATCC 33500]QCQ76016.1 NADPH-dependent oxidoreductase [Haloferax mediterranei ATCC 33500]